MGANTIRIRLPLGLNNTLFVPDDFGAYTIKNISFYYIFLMFLNIFRHYIVELLFQQIQLSP